MFKRTAILFFCIFFVFSAMPSFTSSEEHFEDLGDRILYGGLAVDVGSDTYYGGYGITKYTACGEETVASGMEARYLNYYRGYIYFVSGNKILKLALSGGEPLTVSELASPPECLYVLDSGIYYLREESVYLLSGGEESMLFSKKGIAGFKPVDGKHFIWYIKNPLYTPPEESGDEIWEEAAEEFIAFLTDIEDNTDIACDGSAEGEELSEAQNSYTGPYVNVGNVTLPLEEHMPGTFFTKNGQACTCHNTSSTYCIQSEGNCNCMRYYPTGYKDTCDVDLLGAQCFAFARMVFWRCFGFIDHSMNSSLYYNVGSLSRGSVTANNVKQLLTKAAPGAHVRLSRGHSVSILTMDDDFIVIYQGNAGGDGVATQPCVVSTRRYTWEQFASYASAGISYVNMPYSYPDTSLVESGKPTGYYRIKTDLNLRAEPNTVSEKLTVLPKESIVLVTEVEGLWGKISYEGKEGWAFLEYTVFYTRDKLLPAGDIFCFDSDGCLRGKVWKLNVESFSEYFDKQNISVFSSEGRELSEDERISAGDVVAIVISGNIIDSATIVLSGDANGNGVLDVGDYVCIKREVLGTYSGKGALFAAEDYNADGKVDSMDYLLVRRILNGTLQP